MKREAGQGALVVFRALRALSSSDGDAKAETVRPSDGCFAISGRDLEASSWSNPILDCIVDEPGSVHPQFIIVLAL